MRSLAMVTGCGSRAGGSNAARVAVKALEEMSYSQIREKWCHNSDYSREIKTYTDKDGRICRLDNHDPIYADALPFDTFAECVNEQPKEWIIEGVIAHDEDF